MCAAVTNRMIRKEVEVPADLSQVWEAWTTSEGAASFFAPQARIEMRILGPYELYFMPDNPEGLRGSEGCQVLSYLPGQMLSFSWNAPPHFPTVRGEHTWVVVELDALALGETDAATRVTLTHLGWREGAEWEQVQAYFERAWDVVMQRLRERFERGPVDWSED